MDQSVCSHVIDIEDDAVDVSSTCDAFAEPLATQLWNHHMVSYYFKSVREVAPYMTSWRFNRSINENHKNQIKDALKTHKKPHLMGTIQVMRDKKGNCRVMNGQHRMIACLEILKEDIDMTFDMSLMFEVYDTSIDDLNDYKEHDDAEHLFKIANTSLALQPEDEHDLFCKKLVNAMGKDNILSRGIVDKPMGSVHRPRILTKAMFEYFKDLLPRDHNKQVDELIDKMKKINVQLSLMTDLELFGRSVPAESKRKQRAKAHDLKFFLNMDCKYTPLEWIPWLFI